MLTVVVPLGLTIGAGSAEASIVFDISQSGANVVVTANGSADLTG